MTFAFCKVFMLFVLVGCCICEDVKQIKKVQKREAYKSMRPEETERDPPVLPNDFSIIRQPPPPANYQSLPNHQHGPYHHHHHHSGPPGQYHNHNHEFNNKPTGYDEDEGYDFQALNSSGIPLDFAKSINEYSVSDLLLNVIEDGPDMEEKPLLANRFGGDEGNETERNAAQMARPAKCIPELTTVRIAQSNDPLIFYVPECTRVERCGGCCSHVLLACQPIATETVTFSVVKTEYTGNNKLKYIGKEPVLVEKHTKCKCGCKVKEKDCNTYQEYKESECKCLCKNTDEEKKCYKNSFKKLWNPDLCACQCREVIDCSTGFQFDYNECRCVQSQLKRRYILTESMNEQI